MPKSESITIPIRGEKLAMQVAVTAELLRLKTAFQEIRIVGTEAFGLILLLDGHVQLAELDEFAYHESLVHIPTFALVDPKRALVIGGGDGGVLREIRKHASFERIDLVEIDAGVIESCRDHMPFLADGAFQDPRIMVHVQDAFEFVARTRTPYDLIVMDSTDVYEEEEGGLSERLFSQKFYEDCRDALTDKGIVVTQADNPLFCPYSLEAIHSEFKEVFLYSGSYTAQVPSFGGFSAFVWGSKGAEPLPSFPESSRAIRLRYLDRSTYDSAFRALPFATL